jgi:hypothetical protein
VTPIHRYSLEAHSGPYESWPTTSVLCVNGLQTQTRIPGFVIEAQYASSMGDLLITSFDCPFEESNSFLLLNGSGSIISRAELLAPYSSFLLHEHWVIDSATIGLHYQEETFYTVRLLPPGSWLFRKPRLQLNRRFGWRRNARMLEAYDRLQTRLAEIATSDALR